MDDGPASWRMPTRKQMEHMARRVGREGLPVRGLAPGAICLTNTGKPSWRPRAPTADKPAPAPPSGYCGSVRVPGHVLRVDCQRCGRIIEIQMADALRLYGAEAVWRGVRQRLLDDTCTHRTGRYEENGCWPSFH